MSHGGGEAAGHCRAQRRLQPCPKNGVAAPDRGHVMAVPARDENSAGVGIDRRTVTDSGTRSSWKRPTVDPPTHRGSGTHKDTLQTTPKAGTLDFQRVFQS